MKKITLLISKDNVYQYIEPSKFKEKSGLRMKLMVERKYTHEKEVRK